MARLVAATSSASEVNGFCTATTCNPLACSSGICTCLAVRVVHNGLGDFALQARQADVKPCAKEVNVARIAQVYFGIDGCVSRKLDLHLVGHKPHCTDETGRPTGGKQLLRIGTSSWDSGSRELDI